MPVVAPADEIRRATVLSQHGEDLAVAILLTEVMTADDETISRRRSQPQSSSLDRCHGSLLSLERRVDRCFGRPTLCWRLKSSAIARSRAPAHQLTGSNVKLAGLPTRSAINQTTNQISVIEHSRSSIRS
jgi:hypothetical protein